MKLQNLAAQFERLKLLLDIRAKADCSTVMGLALVNAIDNNTSPDEIIEFLKSQTRDSFQTMAKVIPVELVNKIVAL